MQAENRWKPVEGAIGDESDIAEDRDDPQHAHVPHRESEEHKSGCQKARSF